MIALGLNLTSRGIRPAEARTLLRDGAAALAAAGGEDDPRVKPAREALGRLGE